MILQHTLKNGNKKLIPLTDIRFTTLHEQQQGVTTHIGWLISGADDDKGHRYGLIFTPEEARDHLTRLQALVARFDDDTLGFIQSETHEEDTADAD